MEIWKEEIVSGQDLMQTYMYDAKCIDNDFIIDMHCKLELQTIISKFDSH